MTELELSLIGRVVKLKRGVSDLHKIIGYSATGVNANDIDLLVVRLNIAENLRTPSVVKFSNVKFFPYIT